MSRLATVLVATAIASGSGLIGLAAGGMAAMQRDLRAAKAPAIQQYDCPKPDSFDARHL
jgi:hypothetical protein